MAMLNAKPFIKDGQHLRVGEPEQHWLGQTQLTWDLLVCLTTWKEFVVVGDETEPTKKNYVTASVLHIKQRRETLHRRLGAV